MVSDVVSDTTVHARIDADTKREAVKVLNELGFSLSDAIRLFLARVAAEGTLPFRTLAPNAETREAMKELEEGRGQVFESVEALMADLMRRD